VYDIAETLGRSAAEVLDMPTAEFLVWVSRLKKRMEQHAQK